VISSLQNGTKPTMCDLQPKLSKLLKRRPISKTLAPSSGKISATTPNYQAVREYMHLSMCQAETKRSTAFLSYSQKKLIFKNAIFFKL